MKLEVDDQIQDFKANNDWFQKNKKRCNLNSVKLLGAANTNTNSIPNIKIELQCI